MKAIVFVFTLFSISISFSQVGIGTTAPQGQLDVVSTNDTGLVIPRVSSVNNVTDGQGNPPVEGTIVYDLSQQSICFFVEGKWLCGSFSELGGSSWADGTPPFSTSQNYIKATNTDALDIFGTSIALSDDGLTLAIGAPDEDSNATGIDGDQTNNSAADAGAVYIYRKVAGNWAFEAYIKASNTEADDEFGSELSLSANGNTLAVNATGEDSNATGINGDQTDNSTSRAGAVYIFTRTGTTWSQQAYIKASNTEANDAFGFALGLDNSGNTLVVTATGEDSNATGINGDQTNNSASSAGAVYVFTRTGTTWTQEAYLKASNTATSDAFGASGTISGNGLYIAVGAPDEDSNATGIDGDQTNNSVSNAGAVYVFFKSAGTWAQQAYIKPQVVGLGDRFGWDQVSMDDTGNKLAVASSSEDSSSIGINGEANNNSFNSAGAAYVFSRIGSTWSQEAYIKSVNTETNDSFNDGVTLSGDGNTLIVGASAEDGNGTGTNGDPSNNNSPVSGASYVYTFDGSNWQFTAYLKATNTNSGDLFGRMNATNTDGSIIVIGARGEDSNATGVGGDQTNNSAFSSGAVYIYEN